MIDSQKLSSTPRPIKERGLGGTDMLEMIAAAIAGFILPRIQYDDAVFVQTELARMPALRNKSGAVTSELWIDPSGRVLDCAVLRYTGAKVVADRVCELMKQRHFQTPRGPSEAATYATSVSTTVYASPRDSKKLVQDLELLNNPDRTLAASISDASIGENVYLLLAIDQNGHLAACMPEQERLIEKLAGYCDQVADEEFTIRRDQGQPVSYVRRYRIKLEPMS